MEKQEIIQVQVPTNALKKCTAQGFFSEFPRREKNLELGSSFNFELMRVAL